MLNNVYQKFSYCWLSSLSLTDNTVFWYGGLQLTFWQSCAKPLIHQKFWRWKSIMKWCRAIYHQCNVWVIIFLKQALNGFHGSFYLPVTSEDSVGCLLCGWHHIWLQIAYIYRMNMGIFCPIQLLEVPMPSKDWFCERLSQKKTAHSIYLSRRAVVSREAKKKQHARVIRPTRPLQWVITRMRALIF